MIKAKEIAMAEYKCPECGSEKITYKGKTVHGSSKRFLMILCADCGRFLGVVNDMSQIKDAIRSIGHTLNVPTGL
jgi:ribosomal protein S27E